MQTIKFDDFLNRNFKKENKVVSHFKNHKKIYFAAGTALVFLGIPDITFASTGIDVKARELYFGKFMTFAKWAIIIKGGWDTINKAMKEDFDGAKKSFFSYLIVYVILLGLPWALDEVEGVFAT
ncbi:hypothetical protein ACW2QC_07335 [Virgibacillus sp. FSP13]